jgi:hypothetical protein
VEKARAHPFRNAHLLDGEGRNLLLHPRARLVGELFECAAGARIRAKSSARTTAPKLRRVGDLGEEGRYRMPEMRDSGLPFALDLAV